MLPGLMLGNPACITRRHSRVSAGPYNNSVQFPGAALLFRAGFWVKRRQPHFYCYRCQRQKSCKNGICNTDTTPLQFVLVL